MGLYRLRGAKDDLLSGAASFAHSHGVTPNAVTALGLCLGVAAGAAFMFRQIPVGLALGLVSVFCDMLDGAIARRFGMETRRGRFLDSASDRVCELAVVFGALAGGIIEPLGLLAIVGSTTLFLFRVLSDRRGIGTDYVLFGRTERLVFLLLGLLLPYPPASTACFIVAGGFGFVSSLQIAIKLRRQ